MKKYLLGQYEKSMPSDLSFKEKLQYVKQFGFDYLEISIDETDEKLARLDYTDDQIKEIKEAIDLTGVPILSMCLSGHRKYPLGSSNSETRRESLEIMKKAIKLSQKLGIRIIQLAGYDVYYEESSDQTRTYFLENLKKCVSMASSCGVILAFETMETAFMDTVEKSMHYVNLINSPYLQVYPDIGNLTNASLLYESTVNEDLRKGTGHIVAAHLKETIPNHYREITFGSGHTNFKSNIKQLKEQGVNIYVGEFWYTGQPDWKTICQETNKFLRGYLEQIY